MLSEEESKERLDEADENGDGRVTWKEYVHEIFGIDLEDDSDTIPLNEIEEQQVGNRNCGAINLLLPPTCYYGYPTF
jgi:hypothetical protein